jgi:hypothetical protein
MMKNFGGFFGALGQTTNKIAADKSEVTDKAGFKSAKTRKLERKDEYDKKRKEAKDAIKAEDRGSDSRKEKRFAASKLAREERKARANDRKQAWAEKQVAKGKYENKEAAMARFDGLKEIRAKSADKMADIINSKPPEPTDADEETQDDVNTTTYTGAMPVVDNEKIVSSNMIPGQL